MCRSIDCTECERQLRCSLSEHRFRHSLGVADICVLLNDRYHVGLDSHEVRFAALMHDRAREWGNEKLLAYAREHTLDLFPEEWEHPVLLHAPVAADLLKEEGCIPLICKAVRFHSIASIDMGALGLLLYVGDYIEPNRVHLTAEDRAKLLALPTCEDLCLAVLKREKAHLASKGRVLLPTTEQLYRFLEDGGRL